MRARAAALAARVKPQYAAVVLFILAFALAGASILFTVHYVRSFQASQARQGQAVERKLCTTLGRLAALDPPPGSPAANPSRGYLQDLHATLAELSPDLGCPQFPAKNVKSP